MQQKRIIEAILKYVEKNNSSLEELAIKTNSSTDDLLHLKKSFETIEKILEIVGLPLNTLLNNVDEDYIIRELGKNMQNNFATGSTQNFIINNKRINEEELLRQINELKEKNRELSEENSTLSNLLNHKTMLIEYNKNFKTKEVSKSPFHIFQFIVNQIITHVNIRH